MTFGLLPFLIPCGDGRRASSKAAIAKASVLNDCVSAYPHRLPITVSRPTCRAPSHLSDRLHSPKTPPKGRAAVLG